jgi:hypothetical protein
MGCDFTQFTNSIIEIAELHQIEFGFKFHLLANSEILRLDTKLDFLSDKRTE